MTGVGEALSNAAAKYTSSPYRARRAVKRATHALVRRVGTVPTELPMPEPKLGRINSTDHARRAISDERARGIDLDDEVLEELGDKVAGCLNVIKDMKQTEETFLEKQKRVAPHVHRVQLGKQHTAMWELMKRSGDPECELPFEDSILRNFLHGIPVIGPVQRSGVYAKETKPSRTGRDPMLFAPGEWHAPWKIPTKPPKGMSDDNNFRLWYEFVADTQLRGEVDASELEAPPVPAFGTEQGGFDESTCRAKKLRRILNWHKNNKGSPMFERIRLTSHMSAIEMIQLCIVATNQGAEFAPALQMTKDVLADMKLIPEELVPRDMRDWVTEIDSELSTVCDDLKTACAADQSFVPAMAKLDFRKYYFQFGVDRIMANSVVIWDPVQRKMRLFVSDCCQFGNIHSIFGACRVSESLARISCVLLGVPTMIYIDDSIIVARESRLVRYTAAVSALYTGLGFWMSTEKTETHALQEALGVLGLAYRRAKEMMILEPTEKRQLKGVEKLEALKQQMVVGAADPKEIERVVGDVVFIIYIATNRRGMKELNELCKWTRSKFFHSSKNRIAEKAKFVAACAELQDIIRAKPQLKICNRKRYTLATDAALEKGRAVIGGIDMGGESTAFSAEIAQDWLTRLTADCGVMFSANQCEHIQIFELLAVLFAVVSLAARVGPGPKQLLTFVDNLAAVFSLVKTSIKSPPGQLLVDVIIEFLDENDMAAYMKYVKSAENIGDAFTRADKFRELFGCVQFKLTGRTETDQIMQRVAEMIMQKAQKQELQLRVATEMLLKAKTDRNEKKQELKVNRAVKVRRSAHGKGLSRSARKCVANGKRS